MLIPASYFFPDTTDKACLNRSPRTSDPDGMALDADWSARRVFGIDRALASAVAMVVGIVAYGGLLDLIL